MQQYNSCMHVHLILWRFKLWNGDGGCRAIYTFFCDTGLFRSLLHITPKEAVWRWKPMPWSSWHTLFVLMLMPGEVWTLQLLSQQYALFTGWPCSATLDGLPLYCWVAMISKCFQFAITALTVNCRGKEFWQTDLFQWWHHIIRALRFIELFITTSPFTNVCRDTALLGAWCVTPVAFELKTLEFKG